MHFVGFLRERSRMFVTIALILCGSLAALPATASTSSLHSETTDDAKAALALSLAPETPVIPEDAESADFSLEILNERTSNVSLRAITLFFSPQRVSTSEELNALLAQTSLPENVGTAIAKIEPRTVSPGETQVFDSTVDATDLRTVTVAGPGVYVLFAKVTEQGGTTYVAASPFVWQGTGTTTTTPVHTIVPLVLPQATDGMPTASELAELTASGGVLAQNLEAALSQNSTLAIDPRIIVATRALGDRAPASAVDLVNSLEFAPNAKFALQFGDADLALQAQLGLTTPLEPKGFSYLSGTSSTQDLAAFPYSLTGVAWPRQNSVTQKTLSFLADASYSTVLLDSRNVSLSAGTAGALGTQRALSLNATLQEASAGMLTGVSAVNRSAATAALVAQLALINQSAGSAIAQNIGLDRGGASLRSVATVTNTIRALPWISLTDYATVNTQQGSASIVEAALPEERLEAAHEALETEPAIDEYGAVLVHPVYLTQLQRMRMLQFFATGVGVGSPGYEEITVAYAERDRKTLNGVRVRTTSTTNLVGTSTRIPIQVSNDLPFSAAVSAKTVAANSSLTIEESETDLTTIEKRSSVNLTVPVQSRVSSGQSALIVTLFAGNGQQVDDAVLPVTIRSSWEALALSILGVLVAAFFGFGIWRSLRTRRSQGFAQELDSSEK